MIQIHSEDLFPGMVLACPILDASQRIMLTRGQVLTEFYIRRIRELEVPMVLIEDGMGLDEEQGPVTWETATQAALVLKNNYESCLRTGQLKIGELRRQVDQIIDQLLANRVTMIGMAGLKSHDEYTYQHSVHVCILAVMMGITLDFSRARLQDLALGALLHDIGKIFIPPEILNKTEPLTDKEWDLIRNHTWEGFNLVRRSKQVSLLSAHVALQHHERLDGSGYPRALNGEDIHDYARITSVADVFDALVSDRPYREGFSNQDALAVLEEDRDRKLSGEIIDLLRSHVNPYPPGTIVELTTGDIAMVAGYDQDDCMRPPVKLMFSGTGKIYGEVCANLADSETIYIKRVLERREGGRIAAEYLRLKMNA